MKKLIFIFLLFPMLVNAQQYTRAEIKHAADSIVRSFVGGEVFGYAVSELEDESLICYRYVDHKGKEKYREVPRKGGYTRGRFKDITVRYRVKYPYPKCVICDTVRGATSVTLNRWLEMKRSPDISFIPDYVWERDSCKRTTRHVPLPRRGKLSHDY